MRRRLTNSTILTKDILLNNGWKHMYNGVSDEFLFLLETYDHELGTWVTIAEMWITSPTKGDGLYYVYCRGASVGAAFTTVGELRAIGKALFKISLPFYSK